VTVMVEGNNGWRTAGGWIACREEEYGIWRKERIVSSWP
jgi:hypothetical protein